MILSRHPAQPGPFGDCGEYQVSPDLGRPGTWRRSSRRSLGGDIELEALIGQNSGLGLLRRKPNQALCLPERLDMLCHDLAGRLAHSVGWVALRPHAVQATLLAADAGNHPLGSIQNTWIGRREKVVVM